MRYFPAALVFAFLIFTDFSYSNESQHWHDNIIQIKTSSRTKLEIYNRSRWREAPFTETFQTCLQSGYRYKFTGNLNLLFAYRYEMQNRTGYYEFENRFLLQFSYGVPLLKAFTTRLSQRTELRYFTRSTEDHIRIRFRLDLARNLKAFHRDLTPSLSYEIFWNDIANEVNRQRIYIGISAPIKPGYAIRLTWIHQLDKGKEDTDILNSGLNLSF